MPDRSVAAEPEHATELARGMALYRAQAYAEAAVVFAALLEASPDDATSLRLHGLCRVRLGDPGGGVALLARAVALAPDSADALLHYGVGLQAAGRAAEAAMLFRRTTALLPRDPAPPLNLATALRALGNREGARAAARKATRRGPDLAEAHYMLGLAELDCGALAVAAEAFARATGLAPRFAEAWVNLGFVRYRQGDMQAARQAMQQALQVEPHHRAATANLAVFDRLSGRTEEAEARLAEALAHDPDNREARLNQATVLLGQEGAAAALALLDGPLPGDPALALHWRLQQALALLLLDRLDEARAMLASVVPVPPAFAPLLAFREVMLALREGDPARACTHAETMERLLAGTPELLPEHRIAGWYDLGRFWRNQRDHPRTFHAWREGHRLLAVFQPFSRTHYSAFMDATIAAFDRTRLHGGPRAGNTDPAPVFIVGMPRSGTTLTEQILASHPEVFGAGERSALAGCFQALGGAPESDAAVRRITALEAPALDRAAARYLEELHALAPDKRRIVDKMPGNFRLLGLVALMLPGARVICCERDPRDIGVSIFQYRFHGYHPYAHDLGDLGWYIARQRALMEHWRAVLPIPLMTVRLSDWVESFDATLRRVLDFVALPFDPACERFYENERDVRTVSRWQVRQPINAQGIGRWRQYAGQLAPLIAALEQEGVALDDAPP